MSLKNRLGMWYDETRDFITGLRGKKDAPELYETRWVWYHTVLVVELFIIILLLLYIGFAI